MSYPVTIPVIYADPSADLDYGFDLAPAFSQRGQRWLAPDEQVTTLTVTADDGITVNSSSINTNATGVAAALLVAWISGGTVGTVYNVRFEFTTNQGRTDARSLQISVVQR